MNWLALYVILALFTLNAVVRIILGLLEHETTTKFDKWSIVIGFIQLILVIIAAS